MAIAIYPELAGRNVIITGGAGGIGKAIAEAFSASHARVGVLDIDAQALDMLARGPGNILAEQADLRDTDQLASALDRLLDRLGNADVLVNNAAHDARHAFENLTPADWDERMAVNLRHVVFATQRILPGMRRARAGSIINLGSNSWMKGAPGMIAYTTAKAAIEGFTRSLAREVGADGIRVNSIAPGWVMTERQLALWATPEKRAANLAAQALKHEISAEDIAASALFLASDGARSITGQTLIVDGGVWA